MDYIMGTLVKTLFEEIAEIEELQSVYKTDNGRCRLCKIELKRRRIESRRWSGELP